MVSRTTLTWMRSDARFSVPKPETRTPNGTPAVAESAHSSQDAANGVLTSPHAEMTARETTKGEANRAAFMRNLVTASLHYYNRGRGGASLSASAFGKL